MKFRRQHPLGKYTADFCCLEAKLVVEIDGACPLTEQGQRHDAIRDHWMVEEGYRVLRFTGKQVEFETRAVCDAIDAALRSTRSQGSISVSNRIARGRHEKWPVALGTVLPLTPPPLSPEYRGEGSQEIDFVRNRIESDTT